MLPAETRLPPAAPAALAVFVISWFATRVFIFPLYIIRSTLFESKASAALRRAALCCVIRASGALHRLLCSAGRAVLVLRWAELCLRCLPACLQHVSVPRPSCQSVRCCVTSPASA